MAEKKRLWLHVTVEEGIDVKSFASLKTRTEVREYFAQCGPKLPRATLKKDFGTLWIKYGSKSGDFIEVFAWGGDEACVDDSTAPGVGLIVALDGKDVVDKWTDVGDG